MFLLLSCGIFPDWYIQEFLRIYDLSGSRFSTYSIIFHLNYVSLYVIFLIDMQFFYSFVLVVNIMLSNICIEKSWAYNKPVPKSSHLYQPTLHVKGWLFCNIQNITNFPIRIQQRKLKALTDDTLVTYNACHQDT
jgi:hypothetical protein